jgi:hypothetical protein
MLCDCDEHYNITDINERETEKRFCVTIQCPGCGSYGKAIVSYSDFKIEENYEGLGYVDRDNTE